MRHAPPRPHRDAHATGGELVFLVLAACLLLALASLILAPPARGAESALAAPGSDLQTTGVATAGLPAPSLADRPRVTRSETALAPASYDDAGGDDVAVALESQLSPDTRHPIAFASDGTAYAAEGIVVDATTAYVRVIRSTDAGRSWTLWGTLGGSAGTRIDQPSLRVAEGTQDRLFLAYRLSAGGGSGAIMVVWSPLAATASWSAAAALAVTGVDFSEPSLETDALDNAAYTLFLVATGQDADGRDVWFTRSTTSGASWESGYRIADMPLATRDYWLPEVKYGWGGYVHVVFQFSTRDGSADWAVRYRRAQDRAAAGIADWGSIVYLTSSSDGRDEMSPTVAAAHGNMWMLVGWENARPDGWVHGTGLRASSDAGASWPVAYQDSLHGVFDLGLKALPGIEGWLAMAQTEGGDYGVMRASNGLPLTSWSTYQALTDRSYFDGYSGTCTRAFDFDPSHGDRVGMVWHRIGEGSAADTLFFDAEWRRDAGWPNLEAGMPVALPAVPYSAPGIAELDGDGGSEIVYSDAAAHVWALDHDGTVVPGWPRLIGGAGNGDSEVATGDLDGDGRDEVVAGAVDGWVYAWRHDGTPLTGWPVNIGVSAPANVSIGALLPDSPHQVVVTCGTRETVLRFDGSTAPGWPSNKAVAIPAQAAIGDVDGDGSREVVVVFGGYMNVHSAGGTIRWFRNITATGKTFSGAPSLADLDLDGDLEIVAPTNQGDIYVFHHDGTDMAGWPWSDGAGSAITDVALAHIWAGMEPELAFTVHDAVAPHTHLLDHGGTSVGTWPKSTGTGWFESPPIMDAMSGASYHWLVLAGARDQSGYAWTNSGANEAGWPRALGGRATQAPASGDIDADGRLEVVYLTEAPSQMVVFDLGAPAYRSAAQRVSWWPMQGYDHERQSCLACGTDAVVSVRPDDPDLPRFARLDPPAPNPARGAVTLRFALPSAAAARLTLFDLQGRTVRELLRRELPAGTHEASWDGRGADGRPVEAGVYFARLSLVGPDGERTLTRRLVRLP